MNDFVLRGFCQECEWPIHYRIDNEKGGVFHSSNFDSININSIVKGQFYHKIKPVWFLSAKQMKIVGESEKWGDWLDSLDKYDDWQDLIQFIQENPFLVARILKEAGEKKEGGGLDGGR